MSITQRIDRITGISREYMGTVLPAPKAVKVELTKACSYRCKFCTKSINATPNIEMDRRFYSRVIRQMHDAGVEEIGMFLIGESTLCSWLPEAIREAKQVGFRYTFLTTNGASARPKVIEKCMAAGLDSLKFSLNFHSPEQLADVAQVAPAMWRRAIDNLKSARRIRDDGGYGTRIYASSIKFDGEQGDAMQAVIDEVAPFCDEHPYWLPLYGMDGASRAAGWKPQPGNPGRLDAMRPPIPCWSVFTEGHLTAEGHLSACCFGGGDKMVMADLNKVSFMEGWNSLAYRELRGAHLAGNVAGTPCEECAL